MAARRGIDVPHLRRALLLTESPKGLSPFDPKAPPGQYAMFIGPERLKLNHVFHAERLEDGRINMFDPQNGQEISPHDLFPHASSGD